MRTRSSWVALMSWVLLPAVTVTPGAAQTTERVSVSSSGAQGNATSYIGYASWAVSANGRLVVFLSDADSLVAGDANGYRDVFVHDRQDGTTALVSVDSSGAQGNDDSGEVSISADGRFVAFDSYAGNLVSGDAGWSDVFVHDRATGTTRRVSVDPSGGQANGESYYESISANGRYVTFGSEASNLVGDDTNGAFDVFVSDLLTEITTRISVSSTGVQSNSDSVFQSISADGLYVAFMSNASNLVSGDTNGAADVFLHGPLDGSVFCDGFELGSTSFWSTVEP